MNGYSPLSHLIALGLIAWLHVMLRQAAGRNQLIRARILVVSTLLGWVLVSSLVAYRGYYLSLNEGYLLLLMGAAATYILIAILALASQDVRTLMGRFLDRTSYASLTRVHVVRIAAIGTLYKWYIGALPGHFILPVGVPDLLIGLTALSMGRRVSEEAGTNRSLFIAWNVLGAGLLLLALPLIELSQPGPFHVFEDGIRTDEVLSFPMSIIPTFAAPLFILLHVAALIKVRQETISRRGHQKASQP